MVNLAGVLQPCNLRKTQTGKRYRNYTWRDSVAVLRLKMSERTLHAQQHTRFANSRGPRTHDGVRRER